MIIKNAITEQALCSGIFTLGGERLKIKKMEEKPIVLHIKEKVTLHVQGINNSDKKIQNAAAIGAKAVTDQMEGGEEVRNAAYIAYGGLSAAKGSMSKSRELLKKSAVEIRKRKLKVANSATKKRSKKVARNVSKSVAKKAAKETTKASVKFAAKAGANLAGTAAGTVTTGVAGPMIGMAAGKVVGEKMDKRDMVSFSRNRKIKFFLNKMKDQNEQQDSVLKLVKDLVSAKMKIALKKAITSVLGYLLLIFLIIAITSIPVIATVAIIYNSPFAIFFPQLENGDTVLNVTSQYESDFKRMISELEETHAGCDEGKIIYLDYEGSAAVPSNYYDVIAVYMVKYGVGDTATLMNDTTKARLKEVFDDMCSYRTATKTSSTSILEVQVTLKSYQDMISMYDFSDDEVELLEDIMNPEYLAMIGYTGGTGGGSSGSGNPVSKMTKSEIDSIVGGISDVNAKQTVSFALSKVGYPYSQVYRDTGKYYDCSSLAYYAWKAAGIDIGYNGATTAAAEAQGLDEAGKSSSVDELQPGDLIFYSYVNNGRYKNISHVAIYAGNGKVVEAANESIGVVYRDFVKSESVVMVAKP